MSCKFSSLKNISFTDRSNEQFNSYLKDIHAYELLTPDEAPTLFQDLHAGGPRALDARNRLVEANLRFVITVAKSYDHGVVPLEDIVQYGNLGLISAAETFDESRGVKFTSYANTVIRNNIERNLCQLATTATLSQSLPHIASDYNRMSAKMLQEEQRMLTIDEFCEATGNKYATVIKALAAIERQSSLDTPLSGCHDDDDAITLGGTLSSYMHSDAALIKESNKLEIQDILHKVLNSNEAFVLNKVFYQNDGNFFPEDIASELGLSSDRVRQIYKKALVKLKNSPYSDRLRACAA